MNPIKSQTIKKLGEKYHEESKVSWASSELFGCGNPERYYS